MGIETVEAFVQEKDFNQIIDLSEKMLENARQERWDDVTHIESERRGLMRDFFSGPMEMQQGHLAKGIRAILQKDREIVKLGSTKREELRDALRKMSQSKAVAHAYSQAS